jgi:hypothetical protein
MGRARKTVMAAAALLTPVSMSVPSSDSAERRAG